MTDERKDRENETQPKGEEHVSDLTSKKLNRAEEEKVKGGGTRPPERLELS